MKTSLWLLPALLAGCTVVVRPPAQNEPRREPPPQERPREEPPPPVTAIMFGVPPGHLPDPGECRLWYPGTPPGRQPRPRSRPCEGLAAIAPAGSWIIYRPTYDRRLVYVRVVDERRPGYVVRVRIFDLETDRLVREEAPEDERPPLQRPPVQPPPVQPPPVQPPPVQPPPVQPPPVQPPPVQPPPVQPPPVQPPPTSTATLSIPPGQLPDAGECRLWIPGDPPGRQPRPKSRPCDGIVASAPAGSWILYRPASDPKLVYVRIIDERRAGVVVRVQVFDIQSKQLVREENP